MTNFFPNLIALTSAALIVAEILAASVAVVKVLIGTF